MRRFMSLGVIGVVSCLLTTSAMAQGKGYGGGAAAKGKEKNTPLPSPPAAQGRGAEKGRPAVTQRVEQAPPQARQERQSAKVVAPGQEKAERQSARVYAPGQRKPPMQGAREFAPGQEKKVESEVGGTVTRPLPAETRARFVREIVVSEVPPPVRSFVISTRAPEHLAGLAVALANMRGVPERALLIAPAGPRVIVRQSNGPVLLTLTEDQARNLGGWRAVAIEEPVRGDAPSFCRSGAGHPVWGRQWCIDKGFGLGTEGGGNVRWWRALDYNDVVFARPVVQSTPLTTAALASLLGDVVFNRLALHAVTLGYVDPLTGRWLGESTGPRVLLLTSGNRPVAEIVDANGDNRADRLLFALRPW